MKVIKTTKSIWIGGLALAASMFLTACSYESPFSKAEEELDDIRYDAKSEYEDRESEDEADKCYYGESSHSDSWCCNYYGYRCGYISSSSFSLTHYEQTVCTMEGKGSKSCNYDDGDPKISFKIIFIKFTGDSTTYSTSDKLGKKWFYYENTGEWDGNKTFSVNVPAYTEIIRVCPTVLDDDFSFDDDMSSGYCYYISSIGSLDYQEVVHQSDYMNTKCDVEWEWYLY